MSVLLALPSSDPAVNAEEAPTQHEQKREVPSSSAPQRAEEEKALENKIEAVLRIVFCPMRYPPFFGSHWVYLVHRSTPWQQEKAILCYTPVISFLPRHANSHRVPDHIP
ncbi:putative ovule protein [Forsythia ovata]|uniref:Ovule protein n=1 Tax=Forsythia ovata TaxID=205694 RepID=A0ABD1SQR4_9LAMI